MSFGTEIRKVRERSLPYGRRVAALRSCVQMYRPLGFHATLDFLEVHAGPFRSDESALLRAADMLAGSRAIRVAEAERYAASRREAKQRGQRVPPARAWSAFSRWHADPHAGALHALRFWSRKQVRPSAVVIDPRLVAYVDTCIDTNGRLSDQQWRDIARFEAELQARAEASGWPNPDYTAFSQAREGLYLIHLLKQARTEPDV